MDTLQTGSYSARAGDVAIAGKSAIERLMPADYAALRRTMVERQVRTFDVTDEAVLARMLAVPREKFLPESLRTLAYSDVALDLPSATGGPPRRLLPPLIFARMVQASVSGPRDRVLDVASATGYSAAIFGGLALSVIALESDAGFAAKAETALADEPMPIRVVRGELTKPPLGEGPFDLIFINGAIEGNHERLLEALALGGRLVTIFREVGLVARAVRYDKDDRGDIGRRSLFDAPAPTLPGFEKAPAFVF
jgi:protein-L-isoaspartate(D-aspartate) O-methyltransferase